MTYIHIFYPEILFVMGVVSHPNIMYMYLYKLQIPFIYS